jgi:hypothetical protein
MLTRKQQLIDDLKGPEGQESVRKWAERGGLYSMSKQAIPQFSAGGISMQEAEEELRQVISESDLDQMGNALDGCLGESELFREYKILGVPAFARSDVPELIPVFELMSTHPDDLQSAQKERQKQKQDGPKTPLPDPEDAKRLVSQHWKVNYTFFNEAMSVVLGSVLRLSLTLPCSLTHERGHIDKEHNPFVFVTLSVGFHIIH